MTSPCKNTKKKQRIDYFFDGLDDNHDMVVGFTRGNVTRKYWPRKSSRDRFIRLMLIDCLTLPRKYEILWSSNDWVTERMVVR